MQRRHLELVRADEGPLGLTLHACALLGTRSRRFDPRCRIRPEMPDLRLLRAFGRRLDHDVVVEVVIIVLRIGVMRGICLERRLDFHRRPGFETGLDAAAPGRRASAEIA